MVSRQMFFRVEYVFPKHLIAEVHLHAPSQILILTWEPFYCAVFVLPSMAYGLIVELVDGVSDFRSIRTTLSCSSESADTIHHE